jgi:predicted ATPase
MNIGAEIKLDRLSRGNFYRAMVVDAQTGRETNLTDVGFGASQALPIIVESYYARPNSVILVEQPEIHLHPKAQSVMGDMFLDAAGKKDRKFIVETHSEYLLARIRRRIAEGAFDPDDVAIYYFKPTAKGTEIIPIALNRVGQYEKIPEGFFDEGMREALEHANAIVSKQV